MWTFACLSHQVLLLLERTHLSSFPGPEAEVGAPAPSCVSTSLLSEGNSPCGMASGCDDRLFRHLLSSLICRF